MTDPHIYDIGKKLNEIENQHLIYVRQQRGDIEKKLKLNEIENQRLIVQYEQLKKECGHPDLIIYGKEQLTVPLSLCPDCGFHS